MPKSRKSDQSTIAGLLDGIRDEALSKGNYYLRRDGFYRAMLRAAFVRAYQFAAYCNGMQAGGAKEGAFFTTSALRGICEDLIVLRFVRRLPRALRDEVIAIEMSLAVEKAVAEQRRFFQKKRPYQQVVGPRRNPAHIEQLKDRLVEIATTSGLWNPGTRKKLPPVEQMASKVGMKEEYDYVYRIASDVVHFNPRVALRNGWGDEPNRGRFDTTNFSGYYLGFSQIYSVLLFVMLARKFAVDLRLSKDFRSALSQMDNSLANELRWPEAVTFEELNLKPPSPALAILARVMWDNPKGRRAFKKDQRG